MWALYLLVVLVPIILTIVFCCGSDKKAVSTSEAKKTDAVTEDDVQQENAEEMTTSRMTTSRMTASVVDEDKPSKSDLEDEPEVLDAPEPEEESEPVEVCIKRKLF